MASYSGGSSYGEQTSEGGERYSPEALQRINQLYPMLLEQYQQLQGGPEAFLHRVGGARTKFPAITTGPVWTEPQVQQRVNLTRSQNDAAAENQIADMQRSMAGSGFSSRSPLLQALSQGARQGSLAASTQAENDLRWGAAQGNAEHLLRTQSANVDRSRMISDDDIRRRQVGLAGYGAAMDHAGALLGALMGINRPLNYHKSSGYNQSSNYSRSYNPNPFGFGLR